jgi:hypothetical protein
MSPGWLWVGDQPLQLWDLEHVPGGRSNSSSSSSSSSNSSSDRGRRLLLRSVMQELPGAVPATPEGLCNSGQQQLTWDCLWFHCNN